LKLLIDHNLSPALARSLQPLFPQHTIEALRDRFPVNTTDLEWMTALDADGGWAALTRDQGIKRKPHERLALDRNKIVFFFLSGGAWKGYTVPETAARLIRLMPLMIAQTDIADRGRFELPINAGAKLRPHRD
jgi:hypothetical protein